MVLRDFRTPVNMHNDKDTLMSLEAPHKLVQKPTFLAIMKTNKVEVTISPRLLSKAIAGKIVAISCNRRC